MLNKWLENEPKETLICAVTSAVSLVLSITGALKGILPFDIAWIAIILCGIPILVGAFKGVVFEHDIKADAGLPGAGRLRRRRAGCSEPRYRRAVAQLRFRVCGGERGAAAEAEGYRFRELRKSK